MSASSAWLWPGSETFTDTQGSQSHAASSPLLQEKKYKQRKFLKYVVDLVWLSALTGFRKYDLDVICPVGLICLDRSVEMYHYKISLFHNQLKNSSQELWIMFPQSWCETCLWCSGVGTEVFRLLLTDWKFKICSFLFLEMQKIHLPMKLSQFSHTS